jgi:hypothetical protein
MAREVDFNEYRAECTKCTVNKNGSCKTISRRVQCEEVLTRTRVKKTIIKSAIVDRQYINSRRITSCISVSCESSFKKTHV